MVGATKYFNDVNLYLKKKLAVATQFLALTTKHLVTTTKDSVVTTEIFGSSNIRSVAPTKIFFLCGVTIILNLFLHLNQDVTFFFEVPCLVAKTSIFYCWLWNKLRFAVESLIQEVEFIKCLWCFLITSFCDVRRIQANHSRCFKT